MPPGLYAPIAVITAIILILLCITVVLLLQVRRLRTEKEQAVIQAHEEFARDVHDLVGHWLWLASVKSELAYRRAAATRVCAGIWARRFRPYGTPRTPCATSP